MNNTEIQKWGKIALIAFVVFMGVTVAKGLKDLGEISPAYNSITVSGEGEAFAVPDVATFSFTVSADATAVADAQSQVTEKTNAILAKLKDLGIADADVKTSDYSVYPKYVYNQVECFRAPCPPVQKQEGYTASETITVKVRKSDDAGKALAAAGDLGATDISGLSFSVDNPDAVTAEARAKAIADARAKAETLAKNLGVRLVRVVSYSDSTGGNPQPLYMDASYAKAGAAGQAPAPAVPAGQNKVTVTASVTYEIR
jgi:uncharacterized protein YggE